MRAALSLALAGIAARAHNDFALCTAENNCK
jgi:hypothetical protein